MKKKNHGFRSVAVRYLVAIATLTLLSASPAQGQWKAGVSAGYTHNKLDIDTGYSYDIRYESRGGFTVGIPVQYNFTDWFGVRAEAVYIQKAYNMYRTNRFNHVHTETHNSYLQVPVMAAFSFGGERLRGFLNLGGFIGGWLSSHRRGVAIRYFGDGDVDDYGDLGPESRYDFSEKAEFDQRRDNRFEAGLAGGIGISYRLLSYLTLELEGRTYYSLTDMQKNYMKFQTPRYNTTFTVQAGCTFTFGQK